jgi:hypothetical protein
MRSPVERIESSVVEVVGQGLVELGVGRGVGVGGVKARRLIEQEIPLGWAASRCDGWGLLGRSRCRRMAERTGGSVRKARIFMDPPQAGQRSGRTS